MPIFYLKMIKKIFNQPCTLKKTDPGDSKPTYFLNLT